MTTSAPGNRDRVTPPDRVDAWRNVFSFAIQKGGSRKVTSRLLSAAVLLVALNVWAADPWQKPYKQWDAQDVRQILNNSPWSKAIEAEPKDKKNSLEAPE